MDVVLKSAEFHLNEEYLYILEHFTEHSLTAIYAFNLNDRYWMATLAAVEILPEKVKQSLEALSEHLDAIPPSTALQQNSSG
jgi:hypothetical protein